MNTKRITDAIFVILFVYFYWLLSTNKFTESVFKLEPFSWHFSNMVKADETRKIYIAAIRQGDNGNIEPLLEFARN